MTVIAAATNGRTAALAMDSATTCGQVTVISATKLIRVARVANRRGDPCGRIAVAACGRVTLTNWLQQWEPPPRVGHIDALGYISAVAASFAPLLDGAVGRGSIDSDGDINGEFLGVYAGYAFLIGCDMSLTVPTCGYHAVGSGGQVALGALAAIGPANPKAAAEAAIEVAIEHVEGIRGPIQVVSV